MLTKRYYKNVNNDTEIKHSTNKMRGDDGIERMARGWNQYEKGYGKERRDGH
jgi:hypothetical protein